MAAWLGSYGTAYFGEKEYPAPAAVIMQYTGLSQVTGMERQPMPVSEQVTELHHTEVWKIIFPRYNKMAQIQK